MKHSFKGTLFRFPIRNASHRSEISDRYFTSKEIRSLLQNKFRNAIQDTLVFLRNVESIEVFEQTSMTESMKLLYRASARGRSSVKEREEWNRIPSYIACTRERYESRDFQTKEQMY